MRVGTRLVSCRFSCTNQPVEIGFVDSWTSPRGLLTELYLQNSHKFEYLGTGATDPNDSSLIREPLMSLKL